MSSDLATANARVLGSRQLDDLKSHYHVVVGTIASAQGGFAGNPSGAGGVPTWPTTSAGGAETRPMNTAYAPRIHA